MQAEIIRKKTLKKKKRPQLKNLKNALKKN